VAAAGDVDVLTAVILLGCNAMQSGRYGLLL
jgi:hypothetical protein